MAIVTERHGDALPQFSGSSHHGGGEIGAPTDNAAPSQACHASVITAPFATAPCDSDRHTKSRAINALFLRDSLRHQALDELLNDIREWRAASHPAMRAFWRKLAMHDIHRFRRDWLDPERAAFEAAVARAKQRRAA